MQLCRPQLMHSALWALVLSIEAWSRYSLTCPGYHRVWPFQLDLSVQRSAASCLASKTLYQARLDQSSWWAMVLSTEY